jgi:malate synthase
VAERVAGEMSEWGRSFFGREIVPDWRQQLDFTTASSGRAGSTSTIATCARPTAPDSRVDRGHALYVVNNHRRLPVPVLYLPKIQTAEEACAVEPPPPTLEGHLGLPGAPSRCTCSSSSSRRATS